ncbi:MAG: ABC transporter ATP-binding protein, partial [Bdellovibrionota bacterium]|nr:ABC transporter ATP-binding protein [Bdellovibrionota bacterium]
LLSLVGLPGFEKKLPHTLSGGEQQRVALARALAPNPDVLLLDEPFSGLDTHLRVRLREDMKNILKANKTSVILVTHDQEEAFSFADRLLIMNKGQLVQSGVGRELYNGPKNTFVASFLGEANFLTKKEAFYFKDLDKELVLEEEEKEEYILRPHDIVLKKVDKGSKLEKSSLKGVIKEAQYLGEMMSYKLLLKSEESRERTFVVKNFYKDFFEREEEVSVQIQKIRGVGP